MRILLPAPSLFCLSRGGKLCHSALFLVLLLCPCPAPAATLDHPPQAVLASPPVEKHPPQTQDAWPVDRFWGGFLPTAMIALGILSLSLHRQVRRKMADLVTLNQALQQKDSLLQSVISGSGDAIYVRDSTGRYLLGNLAAAHLLRLPEAASLELRETLLAECAVPLSERDRKTLQQAEPVTSLEPLTTPDGTRMLLTTRGPVRDAEGATIGFFGVSRDVTVEKLAQQQLLESQEELRQLNRQFQTVLDGIPDHLMLVSPEQNLLWMNRAARLFLGSHEDSAHPPACHCERALAAERCHDCAVQACFTSGRTQETVKRRGEQIFGIKAFPLKNEQGQVESVIKLAVDITDKVKLREEADRKSRLSAVGMLSAGVAHEINNPVGLILSNLATLGDAINDVTPILDEHYLAAGDFAFGGLSFSRMREQLPAILKETGEAARRIQQIVEDLKDFTRGGDSEEIADFQLKDAVQRTLRLTDSLLRKTTNRFTLDLAPEKIVLHGCARRIEQVLVNLLVNACQALPGRNRAIVLSTRYHANNSMVEIIIRDEGVGIPAEHLPKLATPFFTSRQGQGGTGLGLSISFGIVKEHGGTIHFASEPGQGTTVTVTLPADFTEIAS